MRTGSAGRAWSLYHLGEVLRRQGQYALAQGYLEQLLAIRQRVLGMNHPDTARSLKGVSELLQAHGENVQARCYLE